MRRVECVLESKTDECGVRLTGARTRLLPHTSQEAREKVRDEAVTAC